MKDIIIVCAGSTGIEVFSIIEAINKQAQKECGEKRYNLLGFVEDNLDAKLPDYIQYPILGRIEDWKPMSHEVYALANTTPYTKKAIAEKLKRRGCQFETLISPTSRVSHHAEIGEGCIITSYCINAGAKIGSFVHVLGSMIGGHAEIGDYSTTLGFANIPNAKIGQCVYIGSHAVIMGPSVGDEATVCVGSIVINKVKAGTKVFGNPAKRVDW